MKTEIERKKEEARQLQRQIDEYELQGKSVEVAKMGAAKKKPGTLEEYDEEPRTGRGAAWRNKVSPGAV